MHVHASGSLSGNCPLTFVSCQLLGEFLYIIPISAGKVLLHGKNVNHDCFKHTKLVLEGREYGEGGRERGGREVGRKGGRVGGREGWTEGGREAGRELSCDVQKKHTLFYL